MPTLDDFGYTGTMPSDPALLDWLALEFIRQGWSRKKLLRLIVTSATYRQQAGPTYRLPAEQVRDSVLHVSGLLHAKLGGPSVFPPQPKASVRVSMGVADGVPVQGPTGIAAVFTLTVNVPCLTPCTTRLMPPVTRLVWPGVIGPTLRCRL